MTRKLEVLYGDEPGTLAAMALEMVASKGGKLVHFQAVWRDRVFGAWVGFVTYDVPGGKRDA